MGTLSLPPLHAIISRMPVPLIGREIRRYDTVDSTNTLARSAAENGEPEGLVITAEEQIAGRGRMGRKWLVPRATSIQCSILLRPPLPPQHAAQLTPMAALALSSILENELNLEPSVKWHNDVLLQDKKVSGILSESGVQGDKLVYVILGIGLNVNYTMHAYPELATHATTLQDVVGHPLDCAQLERSLLAALDTYYARICNGESLLSEYRARLTMLGQPIRLAEGDKIYEGIAEDVDEDGALILNQSNTRTKLYAGDVTVLKSP